MIYFIAEGEDARAIKIGYTADPTPNKRLCQLQIGNSRHLIVIAFGEGSEAEEKALHWKHRHDALRGEWFKPTAAVLQSAAEIGFTPIALAVSEYLFEKASSEPKQNARKPLRGAIKKTRKDLKLETLREEDSDIRTAAWARRNPESWKEFCETPPVGRRARANPGLIQRRIERVNALLAGTNT